LLLSACLGSASNFTFASDTAEPLAALERKEQRRHFGYLAASTPAERGGLFGV
jgi:hypothetical protein